MGIGQLGDNLNDFKNKGPKDIKLSNAIAEVRQDIGTIFGTLMSTSEGEDATALQQAQIQLSSMLDKALNNTANTQKHAREQQAVMQDLDRANAAAF